MLLVPMRGCIQAGFPQFCSKLLNPGPTQAQAVENQYFKMPRENYIFSGRNSVSWNPEGFLPAGKG
jgi:hypothetical protein